MSKLSRQTGATSQILQVFIRDSSSTTGAGLTGLAHNTSGLTAYYHRDTDTTATAISLVTMTVGTFTSSGFKEIDSTNMPGWYQLCPPNACFAVGASSVGIHLKGATNMAPLPIEIDLQVVSQIQSGLATSSDMAIGFTNLDNSLTTIATYIDTEVAAIKAKTDYLPSDPADASDIAASFSMVNSTLSTIAGYIDTEVAAVLAAVDTEVAAIKAKTDNLPSSPAAVGSQMTLDLTQTISDSQTDGTVGAALLGMESQSVGKWTIVGTTLTLYRRDGTTVVRTFTLDSATAPTSRT